MARSTTNNRQEPCYEHVLLLDHVGGFMIAAVLVITLNRKPRTHCGVPIKLYILRRTNLKPCTLNSEALILHPSPYKKTKIPGVWAMKTVTEPYTHP